MKNLQIYRYKYILSVGVFILVFSALIAAQTVQSSEFPSQAQIEKFNGLDVWKGRLLITSSSPLSETEIKILEKDVSGRIEPISENSLYLLEATQTQTTSEQLLKKLREVLISRNFFEDKLKNALIEPDYIVETEPGSPDKSAAKQLCPANSFWGYEKIRASEAFLRTGNGAPTVVAVLDYGFHDHNDFKDNLWEAPIPFYVDVRSMRNVRCPKGTHGVNFTARTRSEVCRPREESGSDHGTAVAGIIGAKGKLFGVNRNTKLLFVKVLSVNSGNSKWALSSTLAAWEFIIKLNRKLRELNQPRVVVVNHSFGFRKTPDQISTLVRSIDRAGDNGLLLIASAGNNKNLDIGVESLSFASIVRRNVIAVAASDQNDGIDSMSSYGRNAVTLAAPGTACSTTTYDKYDIFGQTSAAAAYVSGAASLVLSACPHLSNVEIKKYLVAGSFDNNGLLKTKIINGRIDVLESVRRCQEDKKSLFNNNIFLSN